MPQPRKYASPAQRQAAYRHRREQARQQQMAARGLPPLPGIPTMPGQARWSAAWTMARALMEQMSTEMQDYYQARTEEWQESERGEEFALRLDAVENLLSQMEEFDFQ